MRVLAITNLYPNPAQPHRAPFNRHQFRLLSALAPVHVIAPIAWTDRRRMTPPPPRRVKLDGLTVDHPTYWFPPRIGRRLHGRCFRASIREVFVDAVAEFQPTIVFAPWAYPDGWAAVSLAKSANLPCVVQVHGSDIKLLKDYPSRLAGTIAAVTRAAGVVAVSHDLARDLQTLGVPAERILVNHDGIDSALFHPGPPPKNVTPVILFVGNLVAVKGVDRLLDAVQGLNVEVVIVGQGPLRPALEAQANALQIKARFTGAMPLEELPDLYRQADLFVLASRSEGVPNVLLEASGCGTPWVASDVGGIREIAHLGASMLVPNGDIAALRRAIQERVAQLRPTTVRPQRLRTDAVRDLFAYLEHVSKTA